MTSERIQLIPCERTVTVWLDDTQLAQSRDAIVLQERGYPNRLYIPRADIDPHLLKRSTTVTQCPFKGQATYYHCGKEEDIAWSYENPLSEMQAIAGALCFTDRCRVNTAE